MSELGSRAATKVYKGQEWREIPLADQEVQATGVGWLELMVTRRLREAVRSDFLDFVVKIREQIIGVAYKVYAYGKQPGNVDPVSIPDVAKIVVVAARTSARRRVRYQSSPQRSQTTPSYFHGRLGFQGQSHGKYCGRLGLDVSGG